MSIAGHDPSGGAGLGTDLAVWQAMGLHGASVCTALTVQDRAGVRQIEGTPLPLLRAALAAQLRHAPPAAVKLGMLGSEEAADEVATACAALQVPVVWDTVLAAAADGRSLLHAGARTLQRLARASLVITPNRVEAARLLGLPGWTQAGLPPAAWVEAMRAQWLPPGARTQAVLLKGGHAEGAHSVDWLCTRDRLLALAVPRLTEGDGGRVHGTGCVYASALAGRLAQGAGVVQAAVEAQARTHAAIAAAWRGADGRAMANPQAEPDSSDLPWLQGDPAQAMPSFAPLLRRPGLYPVLPDADGVLRALESGADTLQLRIKDMPQAELRAQVRVATEAARSRGAQLFLNDHWELALEYQAFGVHLGQDDLPDAQVLCALGAAGLRLGVSTHDLAELARAHALQPSYIALGPVWPTRAKQLAHPPLGLGRLRQWVQRCKPRHVVVGIGGITLERAAAAMDCGLDGIAVIGAVVDAADPAQALRAGRAVVDAALRWRDLVAGSA